MTRITYVATIPDTLTRKGNWTAGAACCTDPDAMFPTSNAVEIQAAKRICARCPVVTACLLDALDTGDNEHGIRGGLEPGERRKIAARRPAPLSRPKPPRPRAERTPTGRPPTTLAEAFTGRTAPTEDGHLLWYGDKRICFQKVHYQVLQVAFELGHGRQPEGRIARTCDEKCFRADHLVDNVLRRTGALCGSRTGYRWHLRYGTEPCSACRRANADADNRLRRTGTSKVAA
ncbi:WhiB family transcriptional regulator [Streptomyces sp. NPDC004539]|uniref:WhiB family transcriptional regulator n=1 Tax=Streptomyces sp. NPDC004539 TaxID=3154280 RepID=UPI0033BF7782